MKNYNVGDKVIMKPVSRSCSTGYAQTESRVLTIKKVLPQYDNAVEFEEITDCIFRMKDIAYKL